MSTPTPQYGNNPASPAMTSSSTIPLGRKSEILIVSHSSLFYWWSVWAMGFIMAIMTLFSDYRMVTVPDSTTAMQVVVETTEDVKKKGDAKDSSKRDALVLPPGKHLPRKPNQPDLYEQPRLHMSSSKNLGVMFCVWLLLVIAITNIPLRGLWSVIVIVFMLSLAIIFALLGWWETIGSYLSVLDIRINLAGYLVISGVLFVLWLIVILLFDQQIYMVFTPGQLRVRQEIGDAETAYDTTGMTIQKQRSDLFRHWILGIGSGDLIVKTSGAHSHEFQMNNVLFIGRKVKEIEEMLRSRQVVSGQS